MFDADSAMIARGGAQLTEALHAAGRSPDALDLAFDRQRIEPPDRVAEQSFRIDKQGRSVRITAEREQGVLYGLLELAERVRAADPAVDPERDEPWQFTDGPAMRYRGHSLGLQRPVPYFDDHKVYDWPITDEHFPWFYDREHLTKLLDRLASQRCNVLYLWSGHPFASLLKLDDYPEMPEVDDAQLMRNAAQFRWLCDEASKRGIWVVLKFYNIHMPDPLAKARGWDIMAATAHEAICDYTRQVLAEFVRQFPGAGLMACMGEVLRLEDQHKWLCAVILPGVLAGLGENPDRYPPIIIRAHHIDLSEHLPPAQQIYPNLVTMMKHNNESFIATRPDPGNTVLARVSGCHVVNVHLMANLEPFAWGSPRFIRRSVKQMLKAEAAGVHVYPLRYWEWPRSARCEPLGDQLDEHFLWWSAWGRYAWNPDRDEQDEDRYWAEQLARHYDLDADQAAALLDASQHAGPVLPQIAGQYIITSGNGQCIPLGQFTVPLAFSRQQFQDDPGYSMAQLCGFPLIGEKMWTPSPIDRMNRQMRKCDAALQRLSEAADHPVLDVTRREIEAMRLLAEHYALKSRACARFFQHLYGVPGVDPDEAVDWLARSLETYRRLAEHTRPLFRDASSLHHYRRSPLPVTEGYLHWTDCVERFERELETAREGGIHALLEQAAAKSHTVMEWNAAALDTDEV